MDAADFHSTDEARSGNRPKPGPLSGPVTLLADPKAAPGETGPKPGPVLDEGDLVLISETEDEELRVETPVAGSGNVGSPTSSALDRKLLLATAVALAALTLGFLCSRIAGEFTRLQTLSPLLGWGYFGFVLIMVVSLGILGLRSWRRYQRLREISQLRELIARYEDSPTRHPGDDRQIRREWEDYLADLERSAGAGARDGVQTVRCKFADYASDGARDIALIETCVLKPLDRRADALIEARAVQTAVSTALASRTLDALIVLWQSVKLIDELSQLYAGRPGLLGTLRLLRRGMGMVVFAEVAQLAAQALAGAVAQKPLALLGGRAAEGTANGVLMLRLGEAVKQECRPAPARGPSRDPVSRFLGALMRQGLGPRPTFAAEASPDG